MNPKILIIDDERAICASLRFALEDIYDTSTSSDPEEGLRLIEEHPFDIVLLDLRLGLHNGLDVLRQIKQKCPAITVIMMTAYASIESSIEAIKQGAYYYIEKPINTTELRLLLAKALEHNRLSSEVRTLQEKLNVQTDRHRFIGKSKAMEHVFSMIERVKDIDSNVLITGESGTGKEVVARAIHNTGKRKHGPLEIVNCAAIPEALLESELFGYEKGAFTGATQKKPGKWAAANGGTLFLDEISEMPLALQAKILRVIQEREVTPLGSNQKIPLDVRIVSATNKQLEQLVAEGTFREDLYFRLNVIPISLPPLRERQEDLLLLLDYFLQKYAREMNKKVKKLSAAARRLLLAYDYPGNVRQLGNIIEYAMALSSSDIIAEEDLPEYIQYDSQGTALPASSNTQETVDSIPVGVPMKEIEKRAIAAALDHCGWHRQETARMLQISERSLRDKIKLYNIKSVQEE
ncbi:sigma-54-dependent transcriptional regulator [Aneurinibacillus aneurinilyticus]|uniref:Putative response regulator/sigma54 interaction protein n=1 Tax=Aneurinibacillus aneurinilyticus ATCC 12856 TaxID=649747 RepID=U1WSD1_ANEAE|nr:sigma-54 dependent transcriptional regulator [Aneurinibacillus aneurinilyticus]ERI05570.1 putative response regulator/sigma54 interaction protein [Aneurinibacillus aneurinilyticus ATCC 12856]MED0709302.1 sigma-54 dependent transcriptional regulator [Aneurinibacillus aneurinilyticus]MED0724363.1 sigma-54 dependent transcriptional regulator [Aneurinibacillus aneurinilyticus]MED0730856.1 sigma-54 dependent transcriptional regulator [Aneurinibacillus aneurinilyticus]MED0740477.1 sigma-54 depend